MINFIVGPPNVGKTYFRKHTFGEVPTVDIWDYQFYGMTVGDVWESYKNTQRDLVKTIKETEERPIILEHTLLKAKRRIPYIEAVREVTDEEINCYVILPTMKKYEEYCEKNGMPTEYARNVIREFEIHTKEEGFDNVYIVRTF